MALKIGSPAADTGMTQAIYEQVRTHLEPDLGDMPPDDMEKVRDGWRKLAHGIATGVVSHLLANLEIRNVQTRGNVSIAVGGATATADGHQHNAGTLQGTQNNVTFDQNNDGPGLIA